MKKLLAILLAVVMLLSVTACSKTGTDTPDTPDGTTQNSGDTPTEPKPDNDGDSYEIVMLMDLPTGTVNDGSFCEATWNGIKQFGEETGATYTYMTPSEESKEAYLSLMDQAVKVGGKVLVCPGYLFEDAIYEAQDKYPDVKFVLIDGRPHSSDYSDFRTGSNVYSILFAEGEVGFMAGYASVMEGYRKLASGKPRRPRGLGGTDQALDGCQRSGHRERELHAVHARLPAARPAHRHHPAHRPEPL